MSGKIKIGLFIFLLSNSLFGYNVANANIRIKETIIEQKPINLSLLGNSKNSTLIKIEESQNTEMDFIRDNSIDVIKEGLLEHNENHKKIALLDFNVVREDIIDSLHELDDVNVDIEIFKKVKDLHKFYDSKNLSDLDNVNVDYKVSFNLDDESEVIERISLTENKSNIFINDEIEDSISPNKGNESVNKYTVLTLEKLLNKDGFFKNAEELNKSDKIKEIIKVQRLSDYISKKYSLPLHESESIVYSVYMEAHKKDLEPLLILSIISVESTFKKTARSHVGAVGLTQVMEKVHKKRIVSNKVDIWSIAGNIKIGTDILQEYLGLAKGNMKRALQMYNGSSRDKSYKYSNKVLRKLNDFEVAYNDQ